MDQHEFGIYFGKIREQRGFRSQRQLALEAGISPATLSRIEAGIQKATPDTLKRLSPLLRVPYEELMEKCGYLHDMSSPENDSDPSISPEQQEFLRWVEENLEESFFYDFHKSPEEQKADMMDTLRLLWEKEMRKAERRGKSDK